jgi:NADPH:quinone reductase-like Zn-dependent oxidoreductase
MRVVEFSSRGGPEVLRVAGRPDPRPPRADELLVEVEASSINGTDLGLRRGAMPIGAKSGRRVVPGFDFVGRVIASGPAATAYEIGDRVVGLLDHGGGGQAEQVLVAQSRLAKVPDSWPSPTAAALPLAGLTALQALYGRAALPHRPGARVLVVGASGGIGTFAVQLARLAGAVVIGTASRAKHERLAGLGLSEVLDHHRTDVLAGPPRFDVVVDAFGGMDVRRAAGVLSPGGVAVSTRPLSGPALLGWMGSSARRLTDRLTPGKDPELPRGATFVATRARTEDLARLVRLVEDGRLTPIVDSVYPIQDIAEAHRRAEGGAVGKVVVDLSRRPR